MSVLNENMIIMMNDLAYMKVKVFIKSYVTFPKIKLNINYKTEAFPVELKRLPFDLFFYPKRMSLFANFVYEYEAKRQSVRSCFSSDC